MTEETKITMAEEAKANGRSTWRGHPIIYVNNKWLYENTCEPIPGYGGKVRPCIRCGKTFEGANIGDADPCLGELPGVDNACCGHGDKSQSYIRFTNGLVIRGFEIVDS